MSEAPATLDADGDETERLRKRVTFYESFDRIIQENIARSADLLREAAEIRESVQREIAAAQAAAAEQVTRERERHRQSISALLGEMTRLQQQIERLGQRLNDELDAIDGATEAIPSPAQPPTSPQRKEEITSNSDVSEALPSAEPGDAGNGQSTHNAGQSAPSPSTEDDLSPLAMTVLVHGVPRAAAALSLQRHLAGLAPVEGVEAREFAEGILRLQVLTHRPLVLDDLGGWADGAGLTPVTVLDDVLEVRLPSAESL